MFCAKPCAGCWITGWARHGPGLPKSMEPVGSQPRNQASQSLFYTGRLCASPWRTSWGTADEEGPGSLLGWGSCLCERAEKREASEQCVGVEWRQRYEARKLRPHLFLKYFWALTLYLDFPGGSVVKNPSASAGDPGSIPGLGGSPGEGQGNPLHYYCLETLVDRGAWWATAHGVAKSQTRLSG